MEEKNKKLVRNALLIFVAAAVIAVLLAVLKGQMTGFATLQTFETETLVAGTINSPGLSFEKVPNFVAKVGELVHFNVYPNIDNPVFTDNSLFFNISQEGVVDFVPGLEDVGKHNVLILLNDGTDRFYYQNVVVIVEE
jgi:hypothetical protein